MGIANTVSAMSFCGFVSQPNDWEKQLPVRGLDEYPLLPVVEGHSVI